MYCANINLGKIIIYADVNSTYKPYYKKKSTFIKNKIHS